MDIATTAKPAARVTPIIDITTMWLGHMRDDASRADDQATEIAAYSILWFCGTGRAFTGLERAMAHMTKGTLRAFVARVAKGMQAEGKARRGSAGSIVTGDLTNDVLARALGCKDAVGAQNFCCGHPYGNRLTLG